jgi:hypothetical protein
MDVLLVTFYHHPLFAAGRENNGSRRAWELQRLKAPQDLAKIVNVVLIYPILLMFMVQQ